ncbi:D-alanyl-D-alanine carboxypeptidase family protein [Aureimonas sp. AU22]|uniref:D-alanyl-D-alanine carboxypeptidase family protein n=1 Tax=Aureimonas sp. AU22 TaxID=1638162 RepID=UPI000705CE3B|nr:D-alanyl-D-alanine carboxypeptidase family protein [Aureimonas sp. AU22]BAT30099.1 peptidase M15B and M15C DD-carboxypeptidase VanY /endolysin precursor [Aureimonas sp. AU22]
MAAATVTRKLVVTSDTSGLQKGARDVQSFGQQTESAAATLKRMKAEMDPAAYKSLAAGMKPAIEAERQMASMTKALTAELKPFGDALRKQQTDSLKAAEAVNKLASAEMKRAENLRRAYDDTYANATRFLKVEQDVAHQIGLRNLTTEQGNVILATAAKRFDQMGKGAEAANQNVKLTSGQVQGLGFQINDMGTMLAMGASPFQILASQAGQVVQVLQEGGGVKVSIGAIATAVGGFVTSLGPVGIALGATTAAAGALWLMSDGPEAKAAKNSMDEFKRLIDSVRDSFGEAGRAADLVYSAGAKLTPGMALGQLVDSMKTAKEEMKAAVENLGRGEAVRLDMGTLGSASAVLDLFNGELRNAQSEIRELYGQFTRGEIEAKAFVERMAMIQIKPGASDEVKALAGEMRRLGTDVLNAATNTQALQAAMDAIVNSRSRLPKPAAQDRPDNAGLERRFGDRINPDVTDDLRKQLEDQAAALTKTETATRSYSDAVAEQKASIEKSVAELRLQVDMYGQSEGAIAAARFKLDAMTEAQRASNDAKAGAIDPALVDQINREADEIGRLTDKIRTNTAAERERQKAAEDAKRQRERVAEFTADVEFERSILDFSENEQEIRQIIRNLDVDFSSYEGQRLAAAMRFNESVRDQQDAMSDMGEVASDVFGDMIEALGKGGSLIDNLAQALSGLGQKLASAGLDRMFGGLFGAGQRHAANQNNIGNIFTGSLASVPPSSFVPVPTPAVRDTTQRLAQGVTQSVSNNLLSSLLGAGKSESHISGLNAQFATALTNMLEAAPAAVQSAITINSGFRSVARQAELFDAALQKYGSVAAARRWVAPPGNSQHNKGMAADFGYGNTAARNWVHQNAGAFGLKFPMAHENWHIELINGRTGKTGAVVDERTLSKGVSSGLADYSRRGGPESYGAGRFDAGSAGMASGLSRGQAGMGVLFGLAGIAGNGYASGSPLMSGISGLMGGYELAGQFGGALGLGAMANPIGMALGAGVGIISSPVGKRKRATLADMQRRYAEHLATKGNDDDSDQRLLAA